MEVFYDTSALLVLLDQAFETSSPFLISSITFAELENIKTSNTKDADIKYKARHLIRLLNEKENSYITIMYNTDWDRLIQSTPTLVDCNDSKIIITAQQQDKPVLFITADLCCKALATTVGLQTKYINVIEKQDNYVGFTEKQCLSEEEIAQTYNDLYNLNVSWNMYINEYLIIKNQENEIIDKYKYTKDGFQSIPFYCFESKLFGKVKPKDVYQNCLMDSFKHNKITLVHGPAGTGKSFLALGYLFSLLEKQEIDKIIIFCNTVATAGSAKLGFYPGSRTDKLLDSQIGNFLASKLGSKVEVERLIAEEQLILLPMSDIRGYDTSGMRAGIYITEAQNLDIDLMKLALQRIGEDSICILDGDDNCQVDSPLYAGKNNGIKRVSQVFRGDPAYGEIKLQRIYRSHIAELAELL